MEKAKSVLVVDDARDVADATAAMLRLLGYDVRVAYDGRQAIAAFTARRPDVVILDINMPAVDGFEAAQAIRALSPIRPPMIIALSALTHLSSSATLEACGFDYYMTKPADVDLLTAIIDGKGGLNG